MLIQDLLCLIIIIIISTPVDFCYYNYNIFTFKGNGYINF